MSLMKEEIFRFRRSLDLETFPEGKVSKFLFHAADDGIGRPIWIPGLIAKGKKKGPVIGITAAVHGNELNGIRVIHNLFRELRDEVERLSGIIVGLPLVNIPGVLGNRREIYESQDLNRIMPGKPHGHTGQKYAAKFLKGLVSHFDRLIDLHTASFGRINSLYVRVDLSDEKSAELAHLQNPQIIVNNKSRDGSLRGAAAKLGIPAITVEVGDPQMFQKRLIRFSLIGLHNILGHFKMLPLALEQGKNPPIICAKSSWLYTTHGGILEVLPHVAERVKKGDLIARQTNKFGDVIQEYHCPEDGIVVGKSTNPISPTGARILHLGLES